MLNVEYYSVSRRRAVDIAVAAVDLDDMLRSWFGSGTPTTVAPPGFRLLAAQEFPWSTVALVGIGPGMLLSVTRDSLRVMQFAHPGLRPMDVVSLGPRDMPRRAAYALVLTSEVLRASGSPIPAGPSLWVLSEERWPRAIFPGSEGQLLQPGPAGTGLELRPTLEALWRTAVTRCAKVRRQGGGEFSGRLNMTLLSAPENVHAVLACRPVLPLACWQGT